MTADDDDTARRAAMSQPLTSADFRPLSSSVRVEIAATSQRGTRRLVNDDHYLVIRLGRDQETLATSLSDAEVPPRFAEYGYAMLVADGLGEGGSGSLASRVALSTIAHLALHHGRWNLRVDPTRAWEVVERAEWFYKRADEAVSEKGRTSPAMSGMRTALTVAYSVGDDLFVANVGHSRAYLLREGALILLTRAQKNAQLVRDTRPPLAVEAHPEDLGPILADALGASGESPAVEVEQFRLMNGDCVLLCTNGLTDVVDDDRIAEVLSLRRKPSEQCAILTDLANREGGDDNVTVVLAQYQIPTS
jgi:serine/threonine protein phosphatase PrpC